VAFRRSVPQRAAAARSDRRHRRSCRIYRAGPGGTLRRRGGLSRLAEG